MSVGNIATIGAGAAAVGAGAYYFLGPKGKQHRGKAKSWMVEMEKEIEKKLKKAKMPPKKLFDFATTFT